MHARSSCHSHGVNSIESNAHLSLVCCGFLCVGTRTGQTGQRVQTTKPGRRALDGEHLLAHSSIVFHWQLATPLAACAAAAQVHQDVPAADRIPGYQPSRGCHHLVGDDSHMRPAEGSQAQTTEQGLRAYLRSCGNYRCAPTAHPRGRSTTCGRYIEDRGIDIDCVCSPAICLACALRDALRIRLIPAETRYGSQLPLARSSHS
jgi:hypothetical protein